MGVVGRLDQYASMLATEFDDYSMSENLLKYSNDFSQGVWAGYCGGKSNITYNTTDVVSPDGRNDATKVARSSNGCDGSLSWGFHWGSSTGGIIIDTTNTFTASIYARGAVGGEVINIGFNDSQMTNHTLTTSWQRISRTGIANTTDRGFQVKSDTINQTFYIWEGQLEKGSVATDYTPTTTTAISRILPATTNTNITGLGTYYSSGFDENVGFTTFLSANISAPYDLVSGEFAGVLYGPGQGRYMRQNTDKSVIVYNEIDEITNFYNRGDIVTNGLVLDLDAGINPSYPGSGTAWNDLSGRGNTGTLTNGPTYSSANGGSIVFNGSTQYLSPTGLTDAFWQGNWTASFWVKFNTIDTGNTGSTDKTLLQHGTSTTRQGLHLTQRNTRIFFGLYSDDLSGTIILTTGTWYNVVFTLNNTTYAKQIYINRNLDASGTGAGAYVGTGNNARIGGPVLNFGSYFNGFMPSCSFYNRVLTATEIQQNYNALRNRFGL